MRTAGVLTTLKHFPGHGSSFEDSHLGFTGLVVSDDLLMAGIMARYGIGEAAVLALRAGVDLLLLSHNTLVQDGSATDRVVSAIRVALADGRLTPDQVEAALARLERFRARLEGF